MSQVANRKQTFKRTLFAGVVVMAGAGFASTAWAGMMPHGYVKCYGIARAHQNQCMSIGGITRGSAKTNGNPDAWLAVPKGVCMKIVGGSLTPGK
ncbi:hypothetical protein B1757_04675 [Acidithiobacillus marinus]|uniref:DUF2282 domain-containing protein n=1 Tax=Acidithiobacillus marinus TaxID=187490 RepID=A0A2I1DNQ0_9PROT|nr:DUF2282 domain-containing protein [Acidithiobacillus marinus]PKY11510.1 hypothetical protein B1757_04675 [Acidithiobacillus marinus]